MDQQIDVRAQVAHAEDLLMHGEVQAAADEFSRIVQQDPGAVAGHLGIAKAYLALGNMTYVYMGCREVLRLAPGSGDAALAQALLLVVDKKYVEAIGKLDEAERLSPGQAYVHALRAFCYRQLGNSYDAQNATSKAARLSGIREWGHLFPKVEPPTSTPVTPPGEGGESPRVMPMPPRQQVAQRSPVRRRMIQARFYTRGVPVATFTLIAVNVAIYLLGAVLSGNIVTAYSLNNPLYYNGVEVGQLMMQDPVQFYRVLTAMFLHESIIHIGLNMLSLYFVGVITEQVFGTRRFLAIYFVSGIVGGLAQAFMTPNVIALGASGAIFGIFGAFGAFILVRRRSFGPAGNAIIGQWVFWLLLNLYFSFSAANIGTYDHLGGLISGFVIGLVLVNMSGRQRAF